MSNAAAVQRPQIMGANIEMAVQLLERAHREIDTLVCEQEALRATYYQILANMNELTSCLDELRGDSLCWCDGDIRNHPTCKRLETLLGKRSMQSLAAQQLSLSLG